MEITPAQDIQVQRREEQLCAAMETAPVGTKKQIAALRKKAELSLAEADRAEREQVQAHANLEELKQARLAATADLNELQRLAQGAANVDSEARNQVTRLLGGNRGNDPFAKTNFLLGLDALSRLLVLKPLLPELLAEKEAALSLINDQIKGMDSQQ